eukprot:SAG22_NODE_677_length_7962_cov_53.676078_8_plen_68_part_00
MVENVLASKVEHKVDRVFKRDLIKVHYQCAHCNKIHSHGANNGDLLTGFIHRASHCHIKKGDIKITL